MEIKLTFEEFFLFSKNSQALMIVSHGKIVLVKKISQQIEIRIIQLFEFLIEATYHLTKEKLITIQPVSKSIDYWNYIKNAV